MAEEELTLLFDDDEKICMPKDTLSKASPYFAAMLTKGFLESEKREIKIHNIESTSVRELLDHSRGKDLELNERNVYTLLQAAGMLQFEPARQSCCAFLKRSLRPSNILKVFTASDLLGEGELRNLSLCKILWELPDISAAKYESLLELSLEHLQELLSHSMLNVKSELEIYQIISDWVEFDEESRVEHFKTLFSCLHLVDMTDHELMDLLNYHLVVDTTEVTEKIKKVLKTRKEGVPVNVGVKSLKRGPKFHPCVVGQIENDHYLFCYNKFSKKLETLLLLDKVRMNETTYASGYQVCAAGPHVYVIGGEFMLGRSNWNRSVWTYNTITKEWNQVLTLDIPRRHFSVCVSDFHDEVGNSYEEIFLIGGFGKHRIILDLFDSIDLKTDNLKEWPVLTTQMYSPAVCFFRGRIFVIKNAIYSFHPLANEWSRVTSHNLPTNIEFKKALPSKKYIYLTGNYSTRLYRFDPDVVVKDDEKLDLELVGNFETMAQNVCITEDDEVIFNFSDETQPFIESYDTKTGKFEVLLKIPSGKMEFSPNYSFGCFPLVMFS